MTVFAALAPVAFRHLARETPNVPLPPKSLHVKMPGWPGIQHLEESPW